MVMLQLVPSDVVGSAGSILTGLGARKISRKRRKLDVKIREYHVLEELINRLGEKSDNPGVSKLNMLRVNPKEAEVKCAKADGNRAFERVRRSLNALRSKDHGTTASHKTCTDFKLHWYICAFELTTALQ